MSYSYNQRKKQLKKGLWPKGKRNRRETDGEKDKDKYIPGKL